MVSVDPLFISAYAAEAPVDRLRVFPFAATNHGTHNRQLTSSNEPRPVLSEESVAFPSSFTAHRFVAP